MDSENMSPEYDFSQGVRGKYAERFAQGTNLVALDPDVAGAFAETETINEALRALTQGVLQTIKLENGETFSGPACLFIEEESDILFLHKAKAIRIPKAQIRSIQTKQTTGVSFASDILNALNLKFLPAEASL